MKTTKIPKGNGIIIVFINFFAALLLCLAAFGFVIYQNKQYTDDFIKSYEHQQEILVKQIATSAAEILDSNSDDSENDVIEDIIKNAETSGSRYWLFASDEKVIFIKDDKATNQYKDRNVSELIDSFKKSGGENVDAFEDFIKAKQNGSIIFSPSLSDGEVISSFRFIEVNNKTYYIGFLSNERYILNVGKISSHNTYFTIFITVFSAIFLSCVLAFSISIYQKKKVISSKIKDIQTKNTLIEHLNEKLLEKNEISITPNIYDNATGQYTKDFFNAVLEKADKKSLRLKFNQYKFKFYLNANHSIYLDGVLGQNHPHTWEITLDTIKVRDDFVQFNDIEKSSDAFISKFQDKNINEIEPFSIINPTLENICGYFKDCFEKLLFESGWILMKIEISETPARSYIIDLTNDEKFEEMFLKEQEQKKSLVKTIDEIAEAELNKIAF